MTDAAVQVVDVHMGLHAIARDPTVLRATLGSCVGIALVWRAQGLCGLAHCLLPEAPASCTGPGARYVDQAVRTLLDEMLVPWGQRSALEVHLCGGADMATGAAAVERRLTVGCRNIEAAHRALAHERLNLYSADLGGHCARRLIVNAADGRVTAIQVPFPPVGPGKSQ